MSARLFELSWLGGAAERHFRERQGREQKGRERHGRRARPADAAIDDLPWGTLRPGDYPPALVDRARLAWTDGAFVEYATACQLAGIVRGLLHVRAPVDLVGMAGTFVADEMLHVELHARVLAELGGAAPYLVDDALLDTPPVHPDPLVDLAAAVLRTCCIGETLAVPMLAATRRVATHPLVEAVLARIVEDEGPHAQLGWLFFEWAPLTDADRAFLGQVARDELASLAHLWTDPTSRVRGGVTSEGFALADVHALGWLDTEAYVPLARRVVAERIVARLERLGVRAGASPGV